MQELKNLDVLRGKQVWLKTLKGDVVFYSHLAEVDISLRVIVVLESLPSSCLVLCLVPMSVADTAEPLIMTKEI
jgi:hypothetical protein